MKIEQLLKTLNIKYKKISWYYMAFTHTTFSNEQKEKKYQSYERLEFLGDTLLSWMVSRHIFLKYNLDEGKMSLLRASLIKKDALVNYTKKLGLEKCLITGKGGEKLLNNAGILSDIFESFLAALYLDLGYVQVERILQKTIYIDIKNSWDKENKDYKTLIQEYLQSDSKHKIKYVSFKKNNKFITQLFFENEVFGTGTSDTKKAAEQQAAKAALVNAKEKKSETS